VSRLIKSEDKYIKAVAIHSVLSLSALENFRNFKVYIVRGVIDSEKEQPRKGARLLLFQ